jgi:K+-sensing histidine kinase KdpD
MAYLVCVISVALATLLRFALDPLLGEHHAFTLFFAAVAITAWFGGFTPSLLATLLSYFAGDWFFISPRHQIKWPHVNLDDFIALVAFVFSCLAISVTSKLMRDAVLRARQKQAELEHEIEVRRRAEQALTETQAQLRSYAGELEHRVEERTANLRETIRSLEGVCYHIAHDLRAPLRAMDGFSTILTREYAPRLDEDGQYILKQIIDSAGRMDLLIHGLLAYGRLGHAEFPVSPVALKPLIGRVIEQMNDEIVAKQAEIQLAADWPTVMANQALLETVLSNYIKNGLKFVAAGTTPKLKLWPEARANRVRIWVEDNGIGIAPEWLNRVFRIFERVHPYKEYPGTGMGLAIAAKAVERMRGEVGVESTPGKGSRFWFELPSAES